MSTYREIVGKKIKKVSSDPSSGLDGEMWYNSTSGSLKGLAVSEAWASASNMINAMELAAGFGTQTAALTAGGQNGPVKATTEEYNGSGWASETAMPGSRGDIYGSFGTSTAGVVVGGYDAAPGAALSTTLEYNGSSWTSGGAVTARRSSGGAGVETAGLAFGGTTGNNPSPLLDSTQEYGGTSWTSGGAMGTARRAVASAVSAPQTNALAFGGQTPSNTAATEEYNGTAWSEGSVFPTAIYRLGGTGNGTAALGFGGDSPPGAMSGVTAKYDGTSWTTVPNMGTARRSLSAAGSQTAAVTFGGDANPPITNATEEFNSSTNVVTAGAWAAGGAMTTARTGLASAGTQTANVFIGGQMSNSPNAPLNTVELYNGTAWSNNPNNAPYSASNNCGTGTQTAALSWGGYPNVTTTIEFDGSSFTAGGSLSTGRELTSNNIGVQTAAVAAGGYQRSPDTFPTQSEEYNGSSWTAGGAINTPRYSAAGAGTETAAVISGGIEPGQLSNAEEYNGSSWTNVTSRPYTGGNSGTSGTQTDALVFGGTPALTTTVGYDGTSWSTRPSMASGHAMMGSSAAGTSTAALASSGAAPTATEEFTGSTSTANIKTFTTS